VTFDFSDVSMAIIYNQASLTFNGVITNSNVTSGEIVDTLTFTKTAISEDYARGDGVAYALSVVNGGATEMTDVSITDNLGAYNFAGGELVPLEYIDGTLKLYINGVLVATPTVTAGPPLTVSGFAIPSGGNALIVYEARATEYAPLAQSSQITNVATMAGNDATATVSVREEAILSITKVMEPDTVSENGRLTYTFIIQNTGNIPVVATDDTTVSDVFEPILSNIAVTFNGTTWTEGTNYSYDESTGVFTTLAGQITAPAATFTTDAATGVVTINPGVSIIEVTGTV